MFEIEEYVCYYPCNLLFGDRNYDLLSCESKIMLLIQRTESDVITAGSYQIWGFTFGILLPQFLQWKETWYQCKE